MKKKILISSYVLLAGLIFPVLVSCNNSNPTPQEDVDKTTISFDVASKDMIVGDTYLLKARVKNPNDTDTITYSSSKPEVAFVDQHGYVDAISSGETEIRATYGSLYAAKCRISVSLGEYTPTIKFDNINTDEVNISKGSKLDVSASILFNLKEYAFTPKYSFTNEIGTLEGSTFTPTETGETTLTVTGDFQGVAATPISLKINVKSNVVISMKEGTGYEDNHVILFTYGSYAGETFKQSYTPTFEVYEDGTKVTSPNISVTCDPKDLITYNAGSHKIEVLSHPKAGETYYGVTYTKGSDTYVKQFPIYVNKPVVDYDGDIFELNKNGSDMNATEVFKDFTNKELNKVTSLDGKTEYELDTNHLVKELPSLSSSAERVVTQDFVIYNDVFGFRVKAKVYNKIIKTFDDLKYFNFDTAARIFDGDYFLANDIDCANQALPHHLRTCGDGYNAWGDVGFRGVFDGRGHTIKNIKVGEGGIFGNLGKGAVIKNLGIIGVDFVSEINHDDTPTLASYLNGTTLDNVYISGSKVPARWNNGFVCANIMTNCVVSHCLFKCDVDPSTIEVKSYGSFANMCGQPAQMGTSEIFSDTYIVSPLYATYDSRTVGKEYAVDATGFYKGEYTSYVYKNLNHDKTDAEMKSKGYDFSSFSDSYWEVVDGVLAWKNS